MELEVGHDGVLCGCLSDYDTVRVTPSTVVRIVTVNGTTDE